MLFKFRTVDLPLYFFCNKELETLEHFCFHWNDYENNNIVKSQKLISAPFDIKDIFFGIVHAVNNNVLIKYILNLPF